MKLYAIQNSLSDKQNFIGDQPCPFVDTSSLGATVLPWQSSIAVTGNKAENIYYLAFSR